MANGILTYSKAISYPDFGDRLKYLSLWDKGYDSPRTMSNPFYHSPAWYACRDAVITRDLRWDLGIKDLEIAGKVIVHHINPLTEEDIEYNSDKLFDLENLITVSVETHNRIHYAPRMDDFIERQPGDTLLW